MDGQPTDSAKQQIIDRLKSANNVLVTVSRDPSVDQLAACIGLSLLLNKQGKHAAAVFSGEVPSTLEFLNPGETLEKNTDSLRDFIISLDRSKADKLRYKVEDNIVRIFITPYKTSISEDDLDFSEGDFNVDLVIALGVHQQEQLDEAITAHGRILHDATVASINVTPDGGLGSIVWYDPQASSLSELTAELAQALGADLLDNQIATALLTGVISATNRFSNDKTSSRTMSISAALMAAGANQQLVASKLEEPETKIPLTGPEGENNGDNGTLKIDHDNDEEPGEPIAVSDNSDQGPPPDSTPTPDSTPPPPEPPATEPPAADNPSGVSPGPKLVTEPPTLGGTLTANSGQEELEPAVNPLNVPATEPPLLDRKPATGSTAPPSATPPAAPLTAGPPPAGPLPAAGPPPTPNQLSYRDDMSLTDIEAAVNSPHLKAEKEEIVNEARDEVDQAFMGAPDAPEPRPAKDLNAQPLGGDLHPDQPDQAANLGAPPPFPPPIVTPQADDDSNGSPATPQTLT